MMNHRYRDSFPRLQDCFPFHGLNGTTIRNLNELSPPRKSQSLFIRGDPGLFIFNAILIKKSYAGNYVAGFISCDLRIRSRAHRKAHGIHDLKGMLDLPTELILEVKFEAAFTNHLTRTYIHRIDFSTPSSHRFLQLDSCFKRF